MAITKVTRTLLSTGIVDNSNATAITIDSSENVGIGATSVDQHLHVEGSGTQAIKVETTADDYAIMQYKTSTSSLWQSFASPSNDYRIGISGIGDALTINSSLNVGIGTSSPYKSLTVGDSDASAWITSGGSNTHLTLSANGVSGAIILRTGGTNGDPSATTERLRIDSSGNVGIGTSSPGTKLEVAGDVKLGAVNPMQTATNVVHGTSGQDGFLVRTAVSGATSPTYSNIDDTNTGMFFASADTLGFTTAGSERMRIDSSGKLLLNATSSFAGEALQVTGLSSGSSDYGIIVKGGGTSTNYALRVLHSTGGVVGSISFSDTSTSYNTSSDYRLKENVDYTFNALDRVAQLKPARFNFIADEDTTVDGFLAHEVQDIVPEAVTGEKDAVDDEGNPEYQGIDQSKLVPLLTKAIQEQQTIINNLTTRIETLENA